jgi:hypothetical protein
VAPWFKLHDYQGVMTIRPAWISLVVPLLVAAAYVGLFSTLFGPMMSIRIAFNVVVSVSTLLTLVLALVFSILFFAVAINQSPVLELRSPDSLLRWHKGSHVLPLRDVAAFEVLSGEFSTFTPAGFGSYSHTYSQWRVRTTTGELHVIWHARGRGRGNIRILREFALAAGVPVEAFEAHIREDKSKVEGRQVRFANVRRVS